MHPDAVFNLRAVYCTGDGHGEVLTVEERVNLNGGLGTAGESTLGTLTSSSEK
jgi:hypothetical protein